MAEEVAWFEENKDKIDNYGQPRSKFFEELKNLSDGTFFAYTSDLIWLSAWANNNPKSDYHWQVTACYYEAIRRGKRVLYEEAFKRARDS